MYIIQTLDVANMAIAIGQDNLVRTRSYPDMQGYLSIRADAEVARFETPELYPRMAHEFRGFQLITADNDEAGIWLQPLRSKQPMVWDEDHWELMPDPSYYSAAQLREWLPHWVGGSLSFRVRMERQASGVAPRLRAFKIGYFVAGDLLTYLCEHALPSLFTRKPVELVRWAEPDALGTLPLPPGLSPDRLESVRVFVPELGVQPATVTGDRIIPTSPVSEPTRLIFDYAPTVEFAAGGFYQITDVPCVVLRLLRKENERHLPIADSVRISADTSRVWQAAYSYDQEFELTIAATNLEDCYQIGNHLGMVINQVGSIDAYPYGLTIPLQLRQGVRMNAGNISTSGSGDLRTATLRFAAIGLTESESWLDVPTAATYDFDSAARSDR